MVLNYGSLFITFILTGICALVFFSDGKKILAIICSIPAIAAIVIIALLIITTIRSEWRFLESEFIEKISLEEYIIESDEEVLYRELSPETEIVSIEKNKYTQIETEKLEDQSDYAYVQIYSKYVHGEIAKKYVFFIP